MKFLLKIGFHFFYVENAIAKGLRNSIKVFNLIFAWNGNRGVHKSWNLDDDTT
jgi:hypothetical protein